MQNIINVIVLSLCLSLMSPAVLSEETHDDTPITNIVQHIIEEIKAELETIKTTREQETTVQETAEDDNQIETEPIEEQIQEPDPVFYSEYTPYDLYYNGVIYWGGYRFTWYSEKVLPGGGLNIPGRWSDGDFVRDDDGYLCVASSDLSKGTIVDTPWGIAKVYDCGCASGTIDMYVSW